MQWLYGDQGVQIGPALLIDPGVICTSQKLFFSTHSQGSAWRQEENLLEVCKAEPGLFSSHSFTYRKGQEQKLVEEHGVFESSA